MEDKVKKVFLLILTSLLLLGCNNLEDITEELKTGVRGNVSIEGVDDYANVLLIFEPQSDSIERLIQSRSLENTSFSTITDSSGNYSLEIPEGNYQVTATKNDTLGAYKQNIVVTSRSVTQVDIVLTATGSLSGTVTLNGDTHGLNLVGTIVWLEGTSYLTATNIDGDYIIKNVPIGEYTVTAHQDDYDPGNWTDQVVTAGQTTDVPTINLLYEGTALGDQDEPVAPDNFTAVSVTETQINLSWTDTPNNEQGYKIERKPNGGAFLEIATVAANVESYEDTNLLSGETYYYQIKAYNGFGESPIQAANAITVPTPPTNLTATANGTSRVELTWNDNSETVEFVLIERKEGIDGEWSNIYTVPAGTQAYVDTGLTANTTYYYRLQSYNVGNSGYSEEVNVLTVNGSIAPSNLNIDNITPSMLRLTWESPSSDVTLFDIERRTTGGSYNFYAFATQNDREIYDTTIQAGVTYFYRVVAIDQSENKSYSDEVIVVVPSHWQITTIDEGSEVVGKHGSIAFDGNTFHVVYFDETNEILKYAVLYEEGWNIQPIPSSSNVRNIVIDFLSDNTPVILFIENNTIQQLTKSGFEWPKTTISNGGSHISDYDMFIDSNDVVHVSYVDIENIPSNSDYSHFYYWDGFETTHLRSRSYSRTNSGYAGTGTTGLYLDNSNNVYIATYDSGYIWDSYYIDQELIFHTFNGLSWTETSIFSTKTSYSGELLNDDWGTQILKLPNNKLVIYSYIDSLYGIYEFKSSDDGETWNQIEFNSTGTPRFLRLNENNTNEYYNISIVDKDSSSIINAKFDGIAWESNFVLDNSEYSPAYIDTAMNNNDRPHTIFFDENSGSLKLISYWE